MSTAESSSFPIENVREQFPALRREVAGRPAVFFDGPAGSQLPQRVIDAVGEYLAHSNANQGGCFATSRESDALLDEAHQALADFVGAVDPGEISFGANMTSLTFSLSRALAKTWQPGDEIIVTRLDHDANVTPWVLAARDAGVTVKYVEIRPDDCTLDIDDLRSNLSVKTRLVAFGGASNAVGTVNPIGEIAYWVHEVGGLVFVDAVHLAPHALLNVAAWNCDFLACSAYKFFGPHVGVLWGRRELLEQLASYKVRPAPNDLPGKWMTGTQNHEGIAGTRAAVEYLADIGRDFAMGGANRRVSLQATWKAIGEYERTLCVRMLHGLAGLKSVKVWGIRDPARMDERVPTISITHASLSPLELAERLSERGIFVWHGNFYALPLTEALGMEPEGMVRIGLMHYNTAEEVDYFLATLAEWNA